MSRDYFNDLVEDIKNSVKQDISVAYLAKITKIKPPKANVQPLAMIDGKKQSEVLSVHFLALNDKLDYSVGDIVLVVCLDHDNALYRDGKKFNVTQHRMHSADYSVILGRYATKDDFKGGD